VAKAAAPLTGITAGILAVIPVSGAQR